MIETLRAIGLVVFMQLLLTVPLVHLYLDDND
ncbi:hypothetical protein 5171F_000036 [Lactococcus phage 5171F]|uniref:Uncharacterized protein n=1 Tax=Lactococcus phage 5171F TaxID=2675235 RepID=A0A650ERW5_9CAUD|nr:holin [Lactococcus phage 5171F]QGT52382.1 hypothetical protein 5171F_000036 [Lactococcus phage 5171F]